MAKKLLCKQCREKFDKEELITVGGQNYCKKCAIIKEQNKKDRKELHHYINEIYNITMPTGKMLKEIKNYEENGLKLKGMLLTLKYCKEVLNMDFHPKFGLAIISYHYDAAKNDFMKKNQLAMQKIDYNKINKREKIYITKENLGPKNCYKEKKLINMEDILNE